MMTATETHTTPTFRTHEAALEWAKTYARQSCRPCDKWKVLIVDEAYKVGVFFQSGEFICYAE